MESGLHIRVSLSEQTLELLRGEEPIRVYAVSTSKFGPGTENGSYRTPLGSFRICEKYGEGAPPSTIFRSREPDGEWDPAEPADADLVLARILRLDGLDADNSNSYQRYIYIHGTNHEDRIGTPASQGCVRMRRADVIELYEFVPLETRVKIDLV